MEDNKRKIEAKEFLNKTVVITGASSGIGKACALYYLNEGAKVFLCDRDENPLIFHFFLHIFIRSNHKNFRLGDIICCAYQSFMILN